jgi:hypothetical protein
MRRLSMEELQQRRGGLLEDLGRVGDFRLGSLLYRYRRCGKANCACADPNHEGHGGWVISKKVGGKTVMSTVPDEQQIPGVKRQLEEGRKFWKVAEQFAEASDEWSRRQLADEVAEAAAAKKGASKKPSKRKSSPKSTR